MKLIPNCEEKKNAKERIDPRIIAVTPFNIYIYMHLVKSVLSTNLSLVLPFTNHSAAISPNYLTEGYILNY